MTKSAIKVFGLTLILTFLLCSGAFAKPPKCQVRCYQCPTYCKAIIPKYCLQYPLMGDDNTGMSYYAYDRYDYDDVALTCTLITADYGWAPSSSSAPQICPNCQANPPTRKDGITRATAKHQLKDKIKKNHGLRNRIPHEAEFIWKDMQGASHRHVWDPRDGLIDVSEPQWIRVETEEQGLILIKKLSARINVRRALERATPQLPPVILNMIPDRVRDVEFGVESETENGPQDPDLNHPSTAEYSLLAGSDLFRGRIRAGGGTSELWITTNTVLR